MVMGGAWIYGSGFPKSLDVGKAIDKQANAAPLWDAIRAHLREWRDRAGMTNTDLNRAVGSASSGCGMAAHWTRTGPNQQAIPSKEMWEMLREALGWPWGELDDVYDAVKDGAERPVVGERTTGIGTGRGSVAYIADSDNRDLTAPATDAAREWQGWGTALKPAHEPYILARKPLDAPRSPNSEKATPMSLADYACADEPAHIFAYHADALAFLRSLPDEWTHCIITDPPYGLADHKPEVVAQAITAWATGDRERVPSGKGFMGREWDAFVPPPAVWDECLRVLKPGGHLAVFAGSRTVDLMGLSIRLAGFEMRDGIAAWLYGSGFPKSLDVGKAIDKARDDRTDVLAVTTWLSAQAAEHVVSRADVDNYMGTNGMAGHWMTTASQPAVPTVEQWEKLRGLIGFGPEMDDEVWRLNGRKGTPGEAWDQREVIGQRTDGAGNGSVVGLGTARSMATEFDITAPATDAAREWQGWGTALKPAHEPILLARKPLSGTVAATVLAHRTGALNIDATRVSMPDADREVVDKRSGVGFGTGQTVGGNQGRAEGRFSSAPGGRWPTNVVLAHHPDCHDEGECAPGCQVAALDEQSGTTTAQQPGLNRRGATTGRSIGGASAFGTAAPQDAITGYGDTGGASRFFPTFRYQAKAPKTERPIVDGTGHPTVKPLGLMRWLVRLLVPGEVDYPDGSGTCGAVLDPFAGSGATLEAARLEGRRAVGVERDEHSVRLIAQRLGVECRIPERIELTEPQEQALAHVIDGEPAADPFDELIAAVLAAPSLEDLNVLRTRDGWAPEHEALAALRANDLEGAAA